MAKTVVHSIVPSADNRAFYAQLASLPSADAARQAWGELKGAAPGILDDRLRRLTTATVHGRRVYRVLAGGFATKAQAETVCKALARLAARCFVRPGEST
jgi:cell division septation protein DedD